MITKISMKKISESAVIALIVLMSGPVTKTECSTLVMGGQLPEAAFKIPDNPKDRNYLGLSGEGSFRLPQIKARVLIIEAFSMYCPVCQKEAPKINELYKTIEENDALKGKIKLIGVGVGNSSFEVDIFRNKYKVPFPLLSDEDLTFLLDFGVTMTPHFIAISINGSGSDKIIYSRVGGIGDTKQFLEKVISLSGLEAEKIIE